MKILIILFLIYTLYINREILDSMERTKDVSGKVWHTIMYSPSQNFFNSIWLTDKEYYLLRSKKSIKTKYKGEPIIIKIVEIGGQWKENYEDI